MAAAEKLRILIVKQAADLDVLSSKSLAGNAPALLKSATAPPTMPATKGTDQDCIASMTAHEDFSSG